MPDYISPGVYIEEVPHLPPSITPVETAIPAFIGYTERAREREDNDLLLKAKRINSILEYEQYFGRADAEKSLVVHFVNAGINLRSDPATRSKYVLYYSLQLFFMNGGGPCYIVSVGNYQGAGGQVSGEALQQGLEVVEKINEVSLLCFPDALALPEAEGYYALMGQALAQASQLGDRFLVMDLYSTGSDWRADRQLLRDLLPGTLDQLCYGAIYWPVLVTTVNFEYRLPGSNQDDDSLVKIEGHAQGTTLAELKLHNNADYHRATSAINNLAMNLPAAPAIVGVYAQVDNARGVWKAPANISITGAIGPLWSIDKADQDDMVVDVETGRSINAIRVFPGRGNAIIWGARTLAGNDNEWRYIPVRRFFNMVEESVKHATEQFVFEPNDLNTWVRIKSMIDNFLTQQWKAGALMGVTTKEAFYVKLGLNETMTALDLQVGRLIVEIGMAAVRPAEFIILRFSQKMLAEE